MISYETAKRLKQAGFPQPEPAFGQVWYELHVSRYVISSTNNGISGGWEDGETFEDAPFSSMNADIFAPTATDILKELWFRFELTYAAHGKFFIKEWKDLIDKPAIIQQSDDPAEAAALAWLQIHEKT